MQAFLIYNYKICVIRAPLREDTINLSPITPAGSQTGAQNGTGRSRLSRTMRNTRTLHGSNGQMPDKNSPICSTKIELKRESGVKQEYKENEYVRIKIGLYWTWTPILTRTRFSLDTGWPHWPQSVSKKCDVHRVSPLILCGVSDITKWCNFSVPCKNQPGAPRGFTVKIESIFRIPV